MAVYKAVGTSIQYGPGGLGIVNINSVKEHLRYPTRYMLESSPLDRDEEAIVRFEAGTPGDAQRFFDVLSKSGCLKSEFDAPPLNAGSTSSTKVWHYRANPHYISKAMRRLGLAGERMFVDAKKSPEIRSIEGIMSELCKRYHDAPKIGGIAKLNPADMTHVRARLGLAAVVRDRLMVLAAAIDSEVVEAADAFGVDPGLSFVVDVRTPPIESVVDTNCGLTAVEPTNPQPPKPRPNPAATQPTVKRKEDSNVQGPARGGQASQ